MYSVWQSLSWLFFLIITLFKKIKENNKNKWEWSKRTVPHGCLVVKEFKLTSYFRDAGLGDGVIESISNIEQLMQMYNAQEKIYNQGKEREETI